MESESNSLFIPGILTYSIIAIALVLSFIFPPKTNRHLRQLVSVRKLFQAMLSFFTILRITWVILYYLNAKRSISFTLNRFCFTSFFTCFTLIVFHWAEEYHKQYFESTKFLPRLGFAFIVTNIILWIFEIVAVTFFLVSKETKTEGSPIYETTIITFIILDFVIACGFTIYGFAILRKKAKISSVQNKEFLKTVLITLVFTLCFFLKVILFLYRPITKKYMNNALFRVLGYYIPELIPSITQLLSYYFMRKRLDNNMTVDDLYTADDEEKVFLKSSSVPTTTFY